MLPQIRNFSHLLILYVLSFLCASQTAKYLQGCDNYRSQVILNSMTPKIIYHNKKKTIVNEQQVETKMIQRQISKKKEKRKYLVNLHIIYYIKKQKRKKLFNIKRTTKRVAINY